MSRDIQRVRNETLFRNLNERLKTNSVQEKLTNLWLTRLLGQAQLEGI